MPCGLRFAGRETVKGFPAVVGVSFARAAELDAAAGCAKVE
jgi:hypothetical protein